ncbi:MAG: hypothetical protein MK226_22910 [Saprospiraceae bacterium]|nr:hypothetical protein [Saprospiraceae bacterium]
MLESYQFVLNVEDKEIRNKPISIWPNPMIDNINFSLELQDASNVMLNLTDQFGNNEIFEGSFSSGVHNIDIFETSSLSPGVIFYYLNINQNIFTGTVIKQ